MTARPRNALLIAGLAAVFALAACSRHSTPSDQSADGMDKNMAAMADAMDALANNRADAMAGGMMDDAQNGMADDPAGNAALPTANDSTATPKP